MIDQFIIDVLKWSVLIFCFTLSAGLGLFVASCIAEWIEERI